jgi:exopolysaccharide biosynthesis protein
LKGWTAVYTPIYGNDSRAEKESYTVTVRDGKVVRAGFYNGAVNIPNDGFIISRYLAAGESEESFLEGKTKLQGHENGNLLLLKTGDLVELMHEPALAPGIQAYECGSWLVREGKVVIGDWDQWVGVLTNRDPRTAIGIRKEGKVLLVTVDGRQPGFSAGMTGRELGDYMISLGTVSAAMLDGGASTEMIFDGKMVNRPSFKGEERPIGGGILVFNDRQH